MKQVTNTEGLVAVKQLTVGEQKFLAAWNEVIGPVDAVKDIDMIRQEMKFAAYRVAAHAAVNSFFGENYTHFNKISIIPNKQGKGIFEQSNTPDDIYRRGPGFIMIMEIMSERIAESRFNDQVSFFSEEIIRVLEDKTYGIEDTDFNYTEWLSPQVSKALSIATAISNSIWTPFLILNMAEKWVNEVLDMPAVWNVVEALVQKLLEVGEINDINGDEYYSIVEPITFAAIKSPLWENRLNPKNIVLINIDHLSVEEKRIMEGQEIPCLMRF